MQTKQASQNRLHSIFPRLKSFRAKNGAEKKYDLVTAFECIHDMPYPVKALREMHEMVAPDGVLLVADELVGETLEENNGSFLGQLFYNFSVLHCLPQAMVYPDSAATGAVMPASKLEMLCQESRIFKSRCAFDR